MIRVSRGHVDTDGDGTAAVQAGATQRIYGFYPDSGAHAGLMQRSATNAYAGGAVVVPAANERMDYEYGAKDQLVKVIKPLPAGQTVRPEVEYT